MVIEYGLRTDVGKIRTNNEDSCFADAELGLYIVADGMGGHSSGEVASKMAIEVVRDNIKLANQKHKIEPDGTQVVFGQNNPKVSEKANHLISSIRLANTIIYEAARNYPQNAGMGTTIVSLLVQEKTYTIGWIGDSRVYLYRHNQLQQLTTDHSLVQEQINKGLITSEQAEKSEFRNILTRALGSSEKVEVDIVEIDALNDDYILLCSDGLTRMVSDEKLAEVFKNLIDPKEIANKVVELALEAGGRDNVTAITVYRKSENIWDKFMKVVGKPGPAE
jgi:PPM family protein phosphatase